MNTLSDLANTFGLNNLGLGQAALCGAYGLSQSQRQQMQGMYGLGTPENHFRTLGMYNPPTLKAPKKPETPKKRGPEGLKTIAIKDLETI